jgi:2-phospho-L-lactate guanylyltransferase
MQATVQSFDESERTGRLLLDDGRELAFGAKAFETSTLRKLRSGQRVRVRVDGTGAVVALSLATLPLGRRTP